MTEASKHWTLRQERCVVPDVRNSYASPQAMRCGGVAKHWNSDGRGRRSRSSCAGLAGKTRVLCVVGGSSCSRSILTKPSTHNRGSRSSRPQEQQRGVVRQAMLMPAVSSSAAGVPPLRTGGCVKSNCRGAAIRCRSRSPIWRRAGAQSIAGSSTLFARQGPGYYRCGTQLRLAAVRAALNRGRASWRTRQVLERKSG